jgi:hypothetical protein
MTVAAVELADVPTMPIMPATTVPVEVLPATRVCAVLTGRRPQ